MLVDAGSPRYVIISKEGWKEFFMREAIKYFRSSYFQCSAYHTIFIKVVCFFIIELLFHDGGQWKNKCDIVFTTKVDTFKVYGYIASLLFSVLEEKRWQLYIFVCYQELSSVVRYHRFVIELTCQSATSDSELP